MIPGQYVILITPEPVMSLDLDYVDQLYGSFFYAFKAGDGGVKAIGQNALDYLPEASFVIFVENEPHVELTKLLRDSEVPVLHVTGTKTGADKVFTATVIKTPSKFGTPDTMEYMESLIKLMEGPAARPPSPMTSSRGILGKLKAS